ncbi:MAG: hypothetical protein NTY35_16585 [Planctomycetota bacterium]|nr:hypothetical protein [Planctomycetota bacterium]
MKIQFALLALLPVCVAPAVSATPTQVAAPAPTAVPTLRPRFNAAVDALRVKAEARNATRADYQKVVDEMKAAAAAYEVPAPTVFTGERILSRIAELEILAQTKMYELLELDLLKDAAIDAELEYTIARLKSNIKARQPSRTDWDAIFATLTARADAAKSWNPEIDAIVPRLRAEIDALMVKAKAGPLVEKDFQTATDIATEVRVSNVLTRLEKRGLEKKAIEADFADVADIAKHVPVPATESADLVKKVNMQLDEIRAAIKAGTIAREKFVVLRDMLMVRARAAASPK